MLEHVNSKSDNQLAVMDMVMAAATPRNSTTWSNSNTKQQQPSNGNTKLQQHQAMATMPSKS